MASQKMPAQELPVIARFEVHRRNCLGPDGSMNCPLPAFASDADLLVALYRSMLLLRLFDRKAVALQRTGRLGTYAISLGQEAVSVGVASAMRPEDVLLPSYRDNGALLWRGVKLEEIWLFWGGDERGNQFSGPVHDFPFYVPVGSQAPHAAGVAYAFRLRKEPRVAVCLFGDGATSKGDVYEAMNFAGVHKLPVVFVELTASTSLLHPRELMYGRRCAQSAQCQEERKLIARPDDARVQYSRVSWPTSTRLQLRPILQYDSGHSHSAVRPARERRLRKIEPPNGARRDYLLSRQIWSSSRQTPAEYPYLSPKR